eukprot:39482-Amphidinium_carterae.1
MEFGNCTGNAVTLMASLLACIVNKTTFVTCVPGLTDHPNTNETKCCVCLNHNVRVVPEQQDRGRARVQS